MEYYIVEGYHIKWLCECCGTENDDWFNWTVFPECSDCFEGFDWDDILDDVMLMQLSKELGERNG